MARQFVILLWKLKESMLTGSAILEMLPAIVVVVDEILPT